MSAKLIAYDGPTKGLILTFEAGPEWILGRDPDLCQLIVEDLKVSRQHAQFKEATDGITISNLSRTNPILIQEIDQPESELEGTRLLKEGDRLKIGTSRFVFTTQDNLELPKVIEPSVPSTIPQETIFTPPEELHGNTFDLSIQQRWLLKVVSGPQSGAEFGMEADKSYLIGSDPESCDILFYDLSVSKKHAKISITHDHHCFIEDLSSRNGVLINGHRITQRTELLSAEIISLGTSSFVVIDREKAAQTIVAPSLTKVSDDERLHEAGSSAEQPISTPSKETTGILNAIISQVKHHPFISGGIALGVLIFGIGTISLFHTETHVIAQQDVALILAKALEPYPDVTYTFNPTNGNLFLVGHVLTGIEKTQLEYALQNLSFITHVDDTNVLVDQYIWQEMNALLSKNPAWAGVSMYASAPGVFTLTGYLKTHQEAAQLTDYLNLNFSYLDRLQNHIVVEEDLYDMIKSQLLGSGFNGVTVQISNGEVTLSGFIPSDHLALYSKLTEAWKNQQGVRIVKSFVVPLAPQDAVINLSDRYQVSGFSMKNNAVISVVINGLILSRGDTLDGMTISSIQPTTIFLEKGGLKFKINYNS